MGLVLVLVHRNDFGQIVAVVAGIVLKNARSGRSCNSFRVRQAVGVP